MADQNLKKKDSRLALPGFEVYAELKPIAPLWQWLLAGLLLVIFSPATYLSFSVPVEPVSILILALFLVGCAFLTALYVRRKWIPIGIRPEGKGVLVVGKTISENLSPASRVKFEGGTIIHLEKPGARLQLRKMEIRFSSLEDAKRVVVWLEQGVGSTSLDGNSARRTEIWALVSTGEYLKRSRIEFERGICFVVDPGMHIFEVIPKRVRRKDEVTLVASTGFWHYGDVMMKFDSSADADRIEQQLNRDGC